jgi:hypothetical protein
MYKKDKKLLLLFHPLHNAFRIGVSGKKQRTFSQKCKSSNGGQPFKEI